MMTVTAMPAGEGDALWVEWTYRDAWHRMLIDGGSGPRTEAPKSIGAALSARAAADRHFDLVVCTHIDADHITGLIGLFRHAPRLFTADDVWFNGRHHLRGDVLSARHGDELGVLLKSAHSPWNDAFNGSAVVVPDTGPLPVRRLPGLTLTLLSPTWSGLDQLAAAWPEVTSLKPEATELAGDVLGVRDRDIPFDELADMAYVADQAPANASSIAFLAQSDSGERVLFGADAHAEVMVASLKRMQPDGPVLVDLCKVPHHGSAHNVSPALLDAITCDEWLFSTNGGRFGHPSRRAVALILKHSVRPRLWFNYLSDSTVEYAQPEVAARQGFVAIHPPADRPGMTVRIR